MGIDRLSEPRSHSNVSPRVVPLEVPRGPELVDRGGPTIKQIDEGSRTNSRVDRDGNRKGRPGWIVGPQSRPIKEGFDRTLTPGSFSMRGEGEGEGMRSFLVDGEGYGMTRTQSSPRGLRLEDPVTPPSITLHRPLTHRVVGIPEWTTQRVVDVSHLETPEGYSGIENGPCPRRNRLTGPSSVVKTTVLVVPY